MIEVLKLNNKTKLCNKCKRELPLNGFWKDKTKKDGFATLCIDCKKAGMEDWKRRNPTYSIEYYNKNKEKRLANYHKWYIKNKERRSIHNKKWMKENRDRRRAKDARLLATLKGRLSKRISFAIWQSIRSNKAGRKWEALVGYTIEDLRIRLKKTMPYGYTWDDYMNGKLHIDHIIPISAFNYEIAEDIDFQRCWALDNLQLLPASENLSKSNMLEFPFQPSLALNVGLPNNVG